MKKIRHNRLIPLLILSAALLLRVVVPAGYMPAAAGSGLLFELCPEGVPASFAQSLAGDAGHQHGHTNHGDSGHDDHQCPVGHMLLSAVTVDDASQTEATPVLSASPTARSYSFASATHTNYHSRGPPA